VQHGIGDQINPAAEQGFEGLLETDAVQEGLGVFRKSMSLPGPVSPRAAEPKTRTFRTPCSTERRRMTSRRSASLTG
jgi:hypothetical protein